MAGTDLTEIQSGQQVRISGQDSTGVPTNPVGATTSGLMVDVQASVLPTGAATLAAQTAEQTLIGPVTETAPATDTASSGLNGRLQRIAQRLTSLIALLPSTISIPWFERITDGTNTAAVKAASTAAVATDPALVVAISPNNVIPTSDAADGPVTPGAVASKSILIGAQYNTSLPGPTNGQQVALQVDNEGRLIIAPTQISPLPATGSKFSFGRVTTAASTQAPVEETTYTEQTTNGQRSLASSNAGDTSAGTGARTVLITYYDQTGAGPFTESVSLNGTSTANTVGTNICFIESLKVTSVGSSAANLGTITLFTAINKGGTTITTIAVGDSQTFHAHHYVPTGKTCYVSGFSVGNNATASGNGASFVLKASTPTVANSQELQVSDFVTIAGATNTTTRSYNSPIQVVGPARIRAYVTPIANANTVQYASFDLIDN